MKKEEAGVDCGTLLQRMRVTLPLIKAAETDPGLSDLLVNHLVDVCRKKGRTIWVPEGADVKEIPPALFAQERKILAASRIDGYNATQQLLQANRARYT